MKSYKLLILFGITCFVMVVAFFTYQTSIQKDSPEKTILLTELNTRINDVSKIVISSYKNNIVLHKKDNIWTIDNIDNYPAIFEKVRAAVVGLSELKILAEKTDNPDLYAKLGVQGHDKKASPSILVSLYNEADQAISSLIIGSRRSGKSGSNLPGWYVRKPDNPQAFLVEGFLDISDQTTNWFERNILDISNSRIKEITVTHPDGNKIVLGKNDFGQVDFNLIEPVMEQKSIMLIVLNRIGKALEELRADSVKSSNNIEFPDQSIQTIIKTFDGLVINIKSASIDGRNFSRFTFGSDLSLTESLLSEFKDDDNIEKPDPAREAELLNNVFSEWVYELPEFKYSDITVSIEDIGGVRQEGKVNSIQELDFPGNN